MTLYCHPILQATTKQMDDIREIGVGIGDLMKANGVKRAFVRLTEETRTHNFAWEASRPNELRGANETIEPVIRNHLLHHNDGAANEAIWKRAIACEAYDIRWVQGMDETKWKPYPTVKAALLAKQLDFNAWD